MALAAYGATGDGDAHAVAALLLSSEVELRSKEDNIAAALI
jgi:hypothetical protein